jgi:hypothetical protein
VTAERCAVCGVPIPDSAVPMFAYQWRIGHADSPSCRARALTRERYGDAAGLERERVRAG